MMLTANQPSRTKHNKHTFLLIHGAWAGAWVWESLVRELHALGHETICLHLPGDGFHGIPPETATEADFLHCLRDALACRKDPVVVVGHSGGGMLVTAAADKYPDKVSHAVWIAGFLLPDGRSFDDVQEEVTGKPGGRFGVTPYIQIHANNTSTVPLDAAMRHFFQDAPEALAREAAERLTPQPSSGHRLRTLVTNTTAFEKLRKLYILTTDDQSVVPAAQRLMCDGIVNLTVKEMDCGHAPQLTRTKELANVLDVWLAEDPAKA